MIQGLVQGFLQANEAENTLIANKPITNMRLEGVEIVRNCATASQNQSGMSQKAQRKPLLTPP